MKNNYDKYPCLATGNRSAEWLRLILVSDSAFAKIPSNMRRDSDRGQIMLYAKYKGDRHPRAIKLDLSTAAEVGLRLCALAGSQQEQLSNQDSKKTA